MTHAELALTLIDALGLSGQPITELTLKFRAYEIPTVSVTQEILALDADTKLREFGESLRHFELTPIDGPDEEEQ